MFFQYSCGFYNTGDYTKYSLLFPPIFMQQGKFKVLSSSQDVNVIHFLAETFIFSPGKLRLGGINVETGVHRLELERSFSEVSQSWTHSVSANARLACGFAEASLRALS